MKSWADHCTSDEESDHEKYGDSSIVHSSNISGKRNDIENRVFSNNKSFNPIITQTNCHILKRGAPINKNNILPSSSLKYKDGCHTLRVSQSNQSRRSLRRLSGFQGHMSSVHLLNFSPINGKQLSDNHCFYRNNSEENIPGEYSHSHMKSVTVGINGKRRGNTRHGSRPSLNLKPRSKPLKEAYVRSGLQSKIFGGAKPRDENSLLYSKVKVKATEKDKEVVKDDNGIKQYNKIQEDSIFIKRKCNKTSNIVILDQKVNGKICQYLWSSQYREQCRNNNRRSLSISAERDVKDLDHSDLHGQEGFKGGCTSQKQYRRGRKNNLNPANNDVKLCTREKDMDSHESGSNHDINLVKSDKKVTINQKSKMIPISTKDNISKAGKKNSFSALLLETDSD